MENRINQLMELEDGRKFAVYKQALYKDTMYYVVVGVTDDEEDLKDEYFILKDVVIDGETHVQQVTDADVIRLICKYVGLDLEQE